MENKPAYRRDIDGLRAIAVLAVVFYHFSFPGLKSGFVGVDVFFVISGFLIGGMLWSELVNKGRIRLGDFYIRRFRRLAPAFFAVTFISAVIGSIILLPYELRNLGKELISSSLWTSNILFFRDAGYFDVAADSRVLLHTWSLSVEEQFYIFFPMTLSVLLFLKSRPRQVLYLLIAAWAISLIACVMLTPSRPSATFYLFPYRAWEMLSGVLLAIGMRWFPVPLHWQAPLAWVGIILLAASFVFIESAGFPGFQAILPVAGTLALIAGANDTPRNPGRFLSLPAVVFIGLISYSLYLWHWPILVLSRYWRINYSSVFEVSAWLALAFIVSALSWRFIEQPFRRSQQISTKKCVGAVALVSFTVLGVGALSYLTNGLPNRFSRATQVHIAASSGFLQDVSRCERVKDGPLEGLDTCAIGPEGKPEYLIWGDSHLRAQMDGLAIAAREAAKPGIIIWHAGCPPLFGVVKHESAATPEQDRACADANRQIRLAVGEFSSIGRVLLVGRWTYYANGAGVGIDAQNVITLAPELGAGLPGNLSEPALFGAALKLTVSELNRSGMQVYLLRQVPELPQYSSILIARQMAHGRLTLEQANQRASVSLKTLETRNHKAKAPIDELAASGRLKTIDPLPRLCEDLCSGMHNGVSLYFDNNHLTHDGSLELRDLFIPFMMGGGESDTV